MRIQKNNIYRDLTPEEIAEELAKAEKAEREYWENIPYDEAVHTEFRKYYSQSRAEATINNFLSDMTNLLFIQEMQEMQNRRVLVKEYVREQFAKYGRLL